MKRIKNTHRKQKGAKLGQHFLTNRGIAYAVAKAADVSPEDKVLEIGPGTGILTRELLMLGGHVAAVEKDPGMVALLREKFAGEIREGKLTLYEADARNMTPDKIFPKGEYKIAANIPYYITGELIRESLTAKNPPAIISFLVQKEVAERIARSPKESILSLSVKVYGTPRYIKTVSRGSFNPPPSVDSAILAVTEISKNNFSEISEENFFKTVKAGFAQKRKTLLGNLKKVFGERSENALRLSRIPEKARAEDVALPEWLLLSKNLSASI
jgi:16S rRNA (adenine1518-N6/adenine1519-N6)-dimethyltransferase